MTGHMIAVAFAIPFGAWFISGTLSIIAVLAYRYFEQPHYIRKGLGLSAGTALLVYLVVVVFQYLVVMSSAFPIVFWGLLAYLYLAFITIEMFRIGGDQHYIRNGLGLAFWVAIAVLSLWTMSFG